MQKGHATIILETKVNAFPVTKTYMNAQLQQSQRDRGAIFNEDNTVVESFTNDETAIHAATEGAALWDGSHWGLIQLRGEDSSRFLHNQTTNNINALQPGQNCETVFVTSTGRTIDIATVFINEEDINVIVSPQRHQYLLQWMDRFLFPMDKVEIKDLSSEFSLFCLIGPQSSIYLEKIGVEPSQIPSPGSHCLIDYADQKFYLADGNNLSLTGYTLMVPNAIAAQLWSELVEAGAFPLGDRVWQQLRIQQGRPFSDYEMTEDYNPLEAGLWSMVSFDKGCYIGQETIARLNTYKGVKQRLWSIELNGLVQTPAPITHDQEKIGMLTSCRKIQDKVMGLGYIRTKAGGEGLSVTINNTEGNVIAAPFLSHDYVD